MSDEVRPPRRWDSPLIAHRFPLTYSPSYFEYPRSFQ
jgi:hypothetical protein